MALVPVSQRSQGALVAPAARGSSKNTSGKRGRDDSDSEDDLAGSLNRKGGKAANKKAKTLQLKKELGQNNSNLKSRMGDIAENLEGGEEEEEAEQERQEIMKVAKTSGKTNTPKRKRGKR